MHTYIEDCLETTPYGDETADSDEWDELVQVYGEEEEDGEEIEQLRPNGTYVPEDGVLEDVLADHYPGGQNDEYPCYTRSLLITIGLGQCLSFLICGTAITSGLLQQEDVHIPTAQCFTNYVLLCLVYCPWLACRRGEGNIVQVMKSRGWKYLLIAIIDVEANYLMVKAYHYTTVTSVQLLDCFTIPTVLFLSWLILHVRYKLIHVVGVITCMLGVGALVLADVLVQKNHHEGTNKLLGDILCLCGATLYGVSNVAQEFVVRHFNRVEYLALIGLFGSIINGVQFALLERQEIADVDFTNYKILLPLIGFGICMFILYSLMPLVMKHTSATAVNLNLLSADFYALLAGLFLFQYKFHMLYFISFGLIIVGIAVYSVKPPPVSLQQGDYREMLVDGSPAPEGHDGPNNYAASTPGGPTSPQTNTPGGRTPTSNNHVTSPRYEAAKYTVGSPDGTVMANNGPQKRTKSGVYGPVDDVNNSNCTEMLPNNQYEHTIDLRPDHPVTITDIRQESSS